MSSGKFTSDDDALLDELGVEVEAKKAVKYTAREERIIAGFEEIMRFVDENGREPKQTDSADIFERIYAVRLARIRELPEAKQLLAEIDKKGLLGDSTPRQNTDEELSDEELLNELGVDDLNDSSITNLEHVKPRAHINSAEIVATRKRCEDFGEFKEIFAEASKGIKSGNRRTVEFKDDASISLGDLFILSGQLTYIAKRGTDFINDYGRTDSELRVIYSNGTETPGMLMRSLTRALNKDANARRVERLEAKSLFSDNEAENDMESGTIYVLRSKSDNALVKDSFEVVHKIGVTGGDVKRRTSNAKNDPTFLMAEVEVVATYKLVNINRVKLEKLIHRFFSGAQLEIDIIDRFGKTVTAKEWFMVPLFVIDEMINLLKSGDLSDHKYDEKNMKIVAVASEN